MLRGTVLALALANVTFFAWSQGWMGDVFGVSPLGDREPQRISTQVNAQNLRVLAPSSSTGALPDASMGTTACLEAGPFDPGERPQVEAAARASLPEGSWTVQRRERPGVWLVYMGKFADRDQLQKKVAELKRLNVAHEDVDGVAPRAAALGPGLSLGRYTRLEEAQDMMRRLESQRVRTARIVTLAQPLTDLTLRIPRADAELQNTAVKLREVFKGKGFVACART
jgi:hypothetical protein